MRQAGTIYQIMSETYQRPIYLGVNGLEMKLAKDKQCGVLDFANRRSLT